MNKFKVGDRVRCIEDKLYRRRNGMCGTVVESGFEGFYMKFDPPLDSDSRVWMEIGHDELELIQDNNVVESELMRLVREANVGLAALRSLRSKYADQVGFSKGISWHTSFNFILSQEVELTVKPVAPKPAFAPFRINEWEVTHIPGDSGGQVKIGCQQFPTADLLEILEASMSPQKYTEKTLKGHLMYAYRAGLVWTGHTISWADADALLAACKEAAK